MKQKALTGVKPALFAPLRDQAQGLKSISAILGTFGYITASHVLPIGMECLIGENAPAWLKTFVTARMCRVDS